MSMCICADCDAPIDSDDDPDCFVEVGDMKRFHKTITLCEFCRERRINEWNREQCEAGLMEQEAEKRDG